jgi:hypothetical protein
MYETGFLLELMSNLHDGATHRQTSKRPTHRDRFSTNGHDDTKYAELAGE